MNIFDDEEWYIARRYGVLWHCLRSKLGRIRGRRKFIYWRKPLHLIVNELRNKEEFAALEALHLISEDLKLPYDKERIDSLVKTFTMNHANLS